MLTGKRLAIGLAFIVAFVGAAQGQSLPKVRAAYTSIGIQFDPVYIMKELDLPRKYGLDVDVLFVPVSSRAIQAALAGEIQFITSGGVANINANVTGADFVGLTATLNTFVFKVIASPELKKPEQLKGKKVGISRLGGASDFSIRYALGRWGLVPDKDVAIIQVKPYPSLEGFKTIFEDLAKRVPAAKTANAKEYVDTRFIDELDKSGYIDGQYRH